MDIKDIHTLFLQCGAVSTDTRKISSGCLFVAVSGERFDANTFAAQALDKGASFALIDNPIYYIDDRTIVVPDSLAALQQLAAYHRRYLGLPIIALTGSNGKTTTKELINAVLSQKYRTKATVGNLNNHIGVPLTLLSFTDSTEIGIVEMGANHQKEIAFLCDLALPDYGYITNFGKAHLEGFGGLEGVIKGKSELYEHLAIHRKKAFVNLDDPLQAEKTKSLHTISFATNNPAANLNIRAVTATPFVTVSYSDVVIKSNLIGLYNAANITAAIAIGQYFNIGDDTIRQAIESYTPDNNRSQLIRKGSNEIILDAYNANPSSMQLAIENFAQMTSGPNKIAFVGDMFELGSESRAEHKNIILQLAALPQIKSCFIGSDFYAERTDLPYLHFFETFQQLSEYLESNPVTDSHILIKGSRGMALERVLEAL